MVPVCSMQPRIGQSFHLALMPGLWHHFPSEAEKPRGQVLKQRNQMVFRPPLLHSFSVGTVRNRSSGNVPISASYFTMQKNLVFHVNVSVVSPTVVYSCTMSTDPPRATDCSGTLLSVLVVWTSASFSIRETPMKPILATLAVQSTFLLAFETSQLLV